MKAMKNSFMIILVILFAAITTLPSQAQRSKVYRGDKSVKEIRRSQAVYQAKLDQYDQEIKDLRKDNERLTAKTLRSKDAIIIAEVGKLIARNDSLINFYTKSKMDLENSNLAFIDEGAGKTTQHYADLRGKPMEVATASMYISYADKMESGGKTENAADFVKKSAQVTTMIGVVENTGYVYPVVAKVTGPGGFYREFTLTRTNKKATFDIPLPGLYTTTFCTEREQRSVAKAVGPNIAYDDNGHTVDYKATLLP